MDSARIHNSRLSTEQGAILHRAAYQLQKDFWSVVYARLSDSLRVEPPEVREFLHRARLLQSSVEKLQQEMKERPNLALMANLPDGDFGALKLSLFQWRRQQAAELSAPRAMTTNSNIVEQLDSQIDEIDHLLSNEALQVEPAEMPRLTDYMSVNNAERLLEIDSNAPAQTHDQKFGILLSPDQVERDFEYYRVQCDLRCVPISFAFVDIDDFKSYNTQFGHTVVDYDLLPQFQQAIEAHVFFRGFAYREGGDEYIFILPNMDLTEATEHLQALQKQLAQINYRLRDLPQNPTVSIALVTVPPDCAAVMREIRESATSALSDAKKESGKNRIVAKEL